MYSVNIYKSWWKRGVRQCKNILAQKKGSQPAAKVIWTRLKKALKKALPHTIDNQWSIWWGWAGRPLGPEGEGWPNCIKSAQMEKAKKSWIVPENLLQISNADEYSGAARTELSRGSQELLNILIQWAAYKGNCVGMTVHMASNVSCYLWAAGNPGSAGGEGAGQQRVKTR